jgi:hypothetical protein
LSTSICSGPRPSCIWKRRSGIDSEVGAGAELGLVRPFEGSADLSPQGRIDELVFGKLQELGIRPANVCSDGVFLRRVYLDAIGTLPTAAEARRFLRDRSPEKRSELVDRLLERDEFTDYWTMKWGDLLRVKAEFPINLWPNGVPSSFPLVEPLGCDFMCRTGLLRRTGPL